MNGGSSARKTFVGQGVFLFVATSVANVFNYLFHVVMTRLLGPNDYGALAALLAVVLVLALPTAAIQAVVARRTATLAHGSERLAALLRNSLRLAVLAGCILMVLLSLLAPWATSFFRVDSVFPVLLVATFIVPAIAAPIGRGVLQGLIRLRTLGAVLLGVAVLKLSLGIAFVRAGFGVSGALAASVLAEVVGIALVLWPLRRLLGRTAAPFDPWPAIREAGRALLALAAYWTLVSVDIVLVRYYLPADVSGRYAAAALLGRAVLFLPAGVTLAVYPRFVGRPERPEARSLLKGSMLLVGGLGLVASGCIAFAPGVVAALFGREYLGAGAVGVLLAPAMAGFALVNLLLYYRIATGRPPMKTLWSAVVLEVAAIIVVHDSVVAVASTLLVVALFLVLWLSAQALRPAPSITLSLDALWQPAASDVDITVVIPAYNEVARIGSNLATLSRVLREADLRYELLLVSDGSTDGTPRAALTSGVDTLRVVHYEENRGKGYALRTGLAKARGEYVAFIDSDGDLDPRELPRFLQLMRLYKADFVIGSKRHPLSEVFYPWTRRCMSWGYHKLVRVLFGLKVTDTQTGIKLVRRDVLAQVLPCLVERRFAFDLELLVAARRLGHGRLLEAPIKLDYQFTSSISRATAIGLLLDTAAIWYRRSVLSYYDHPVREPVEERPAPAVAVSTAL